MIEREKEREGGWEGEIVHALLCVHRLELSNHQATAAQKSAADWHSTGLTPSARSALRVACRLR